VKKLWADSDLFPARDAVWNYLNNSVELESASINAKKFGLYIRVSREVYVGRAFVHVSVSVPDFDTLVVKMEEFKCCNIRAYMEEVVQACFGYDILLIEKDFFSSPIKVLANPITVASDLPSSPDAYVHHWIYEDVLY
jgi:hypothetical protein